MHSNTVKYSEEFHEYNLTTYADMDVENCSSKAQSNIHFEKCDQEATMEEMLTDIKGMENDVKVYRDTNVGSCRYF